MDSAFTDKLNTNYVPTEDEALVIKELLAEPDQKLQNLSDEIEQIQSSLKKLLREKDDLNEQLKAHKALLSPARRLPPDILQEIFWHCLPIDRNPAMTSKEAPVLLCRVCSQWRDIALATPRLWASIHIAIPADNMSLPSVHPQRVCDNATRIQAITAWLTRSASHPLSISLFSSRFDPASNNSVQLYLDALAPFAMQWKHIHLSLPHPVWSHFLPRYRESEVPMLEKIYFDSTMGYHGAPGSPGSGARRDSGILRAPKLRSVSLIQFEPHILHLPFRWAQLTELNLSGTVPSWQPPDGLSVTETLAVLSLCPNLEYFSVQLSLAGFTPLTNGDTGLPKVVLNKLRGLSVTESAHIDSSPFFENLTAPSITHLKFRRSSPSSYVGVTDIQLSNNAHRPIHIALAMFIRRASQPIEEFELDAMYLTEVDVMKCLALMPGLRRLSLWCFGGSGSVTTPYATPPGGMSWESSIFTLEDTQLRRLTPGAKIEDDIQAGPSGVGDATFDMGSGYPIGYDDESSEGSDEGVDTQNEGEGSTTNDVPENTFTLFHSFAKARAKSARSQCLCPALEEFHCSGAMFSDSAMLGFLYSRSSLTPPPPPPSSSSPTIPESLISDIALSLSSTTSTNTPAPTASTSTSTITTTTTSSTTTTTTPITHLRKCRISYSLGREESNETKEQLKKIEDETGMKLEVEYPPVPASTYYRRYSPYDGLPSVPMMGGTPGAGGIGSGQPVFMYSAAFH